MIRSRSLFAALAMACACFSSQAQAATKWLRADTHNFIIYSSGSSTQLEQFARSVELFDAVQRLRTGIPREDLPNRLTIYLLGQGTDVAKMVGDDKRMVAGIYIPDSEGTFAIANRERADSKLDLSGNTVLFHEYAHHFMFRYYTAPYPSWFIEGYAEFLSTAKIENDGDWVLGVPPYHRAYGLLVTQKIPIENLLFGVADRKRPELGDAFYGRSWLLVHMLSLDPAWSGKLKTYLEALLRGTENQAAATAAFGDLKLLDKALDAYLEKRRVTTINSLKPAVIDGAIQIAALDPVQSQLTELGLKRRVGREPVKTRDALRALAAANPGNAAAWLELALANRDMAKSGEDGVPPAQTLKAAEEAVDRALSIDPDHVRANVFKARLLFDRLHDAGDETNASWRAAREYLIRANAKANLDPEPLVAWYDSFPMQGREPTKNAADGLALAFSLAPEVAEIRIKYAFDLARQENWDAAIRLLEVLAYDPHGDGRGRALVEQLKRMRDGVEDKGGSDKPKVEQPAPAPLLWQRYAA